MTIPEFPFDWETHFVSEQDTSDCVPACVAMCAKYWAGLNSINIPIDTESWRTTFEKFKIHSPRGTNLNILKNSLKKLVPKNGVGLNFRVEYSEHITDLTKLFELPTPVPVILCYDRRKILQNAVGPLHASLLHSIDTQRERVRMIDPALVYRATPTTYDMDDFLNGWAEVGNQVIIVHPTDFKLRINSRKRDDSAPLESFGEK